MRGGSGTQLLHDILYHDVNHAVLPGVRLNIIEHLHESLSIKWLEKQRGSTHIFKVLAGRIIKNIA